MCAGKEFLTLAIYLSLKVKDKNLQIFIFEITLDRAKR